ncbi:hypothetical protein M0812_02964 [Anaeramoeba flamelloides]|uniref:Rap-GAP domain-containing protein n=1 Tax=Anaeramoeba flamelloides TaxID=1746091 RepID=A0AAV7YR51_9EUKA|nr:hypothetical protein M0812_02964 [Anaeramoeba flamelloides]
MQLITLLDLGKKINNIYSSIIPFDQKKPTGVLINFPADVKKNIISSVLDVYSKANDLDKIFSSAFHLKWLFEFTGQAFALPIESYQITAKAVQIYDLWLSEKRLPKVFYEKKHYFLREMVNHLSLIFIPKNGLSKDLSKKNFELCTSVLQIYERLSKSDKRFLNNRTKKHLLYVILGIADSLFSKEKELEGSSLHSNLSVYILKVLFEIWIQLGSFDERAWNLFKNLAKNWNCKSQLIVQWSATIFGLTKRVIGILYGKSEGTENLIITLSSTEKQLQPTILDISNKHSMFLWDKFLYILGNPNQISSPILFCQIMKGIKDLVELFLNIGNRRDYKKSKKSNMKLPNRPDGNTILKIFGKWLFEAVSKNTADCYEGTAVAFSILSMIFSTHFQNPFEQNYLTQFYSSIIFAFKNAKEYPNSIETILLNTKNLFLRNLDGLFILIPHYLKLIHRILTQKTLPFKSTIPLHKIRSSSILILKNLICFPNCFPNLNFQLIEGYQEDCITNFNFISLLRSCVLDGFNSEKNPENAVLLLLLMSLLIKETIKKQSTIPPLFLLTIQKFICQASEIQQQWPSKVLITAISILRSNSYLIDQINECSTQVIPNIIIGMSKIILKYLNEPNLIDSQSNYDLLIKSMLNTIADFVIPGQWIYHYPNVISEVLHTIDILLNSKPIVKKKAKENQIKLSDEIIFETKCIFTKLLNITGNFPLEKGSSSVSSSLNEKKLLEKLDLPMDEFLKYSRFIVKNNNQILTIIDSPNKIKNGNGNGNGNDEKKNINETNTYIIIRDISGKFSWNFKFRLFPLKFERKLEEYLIFEKLEGNPKSPTYELPQEMTENQKKEIEFEYDLPIVFEEILPKKFKNKKKNLQQALTIQHRLEEVYRFLEEEDKSLEYSINPPNPINKIDKVYKFNEARMLCSNLNLIHLENQENIKIIQPSQEFFNDLAELDKISERIQFSVGIIYVAKGQNKDLNGNNIFNNDESINDQNYKQFLNEIGWLIDLKNYNDWKGDLQFEKTGRYTPYFANYSTEIIFYTSAMIKTIKQRKKLLKKQKIIIIWCDDKRNFNPKLIKGEDNLIFIIIQPHYDGLYTIKIEDYSGITFYSDIIINDSILSKEILAPFVRTTAINLFNEIHHKKRDFLIEPYRKRINLINEIINKHSIEIKMESFLSTFFSGKKMEISKKF